MTQLKVLRHQLASLKNRRRMARWATAYAALASAVVGLLLGLFVVDVLFFTVFKVALDVPQRLLVMAFAAGGALAAFHYFTRPLLGKRETTMDMALLVEKQQRIDSDLVAALQFEGPHADEWGSPQLEHAVIDYVDQLGRGLNVFEGFSLQQVTRRAAVLFLAVAAMVAVHIVWPSYMTVFWQRIALGQQHYPTHTVIQSVYVNHHEVLKRTQNETQPSDAKSPQAQSLTFTVLCRGDRPEYLPETGTATLISKSSSEEIEVPMQRLSDDDRLKRLTDARDSVRQAIDEKRLVLTGPWIEENKLRIAVDAAEIIPLLDQAATNPGKLADTMAELQKAIDGWPQKDASDTAVYEGQLNRLIASLDYSIRLGDTWTDDAAVAMIPLPAVEPRFDVIAPEYARQSEETRNDPTSRQLSVLEGSQIQVSLECTNRKELSEAWLTAKTSKEGDSEPAVVRYDLKKSDQPGVWRLPVTKTVFDSVRSNVRFEMQVVDKDGLQLESAIGGFIRIKPDRPPTGSIRWVHKVALPQGKLQLDYTLTDDYGIRNLQLDFQVDRARRVIGDDDVRTEDRQSRPLGFSQMAEKVKPGTTISLNGQAIVVSDVEINPEATAGDGEGCTILGNDTATKAVTRHKLARNQLVDVTGPLTSDILPFVGQCLVDLTPLSLGKGDQLKLEMVITDERGKQPGESSRTDSLVLDITDESGVLAAVSASDERSEQKLNDIIKRQLGIGESP